ncbi:MAG: YfhO family protein [Ignavibacteria bacterium]|nr:YfhO family protein [Ignavibacteria bacterium]
MAKQISKQKPVLKNPSSLSGSRIADSNSTFFKYENFIYIGIILLSVLIFFKEGVFSGKVFATGDILASDSFRTFLDDAKKSGVFPLWVPYIFMGMPNFPIISYNPRSYDFFYFIWDSVYGAITNSSTNGVLPVILYYAIFGIGFYLYSNYKFKNKLIALYCALTATFATDFIQRIVVGHNTKVLALAFFPLILLFLDKLIDSFDDKSKSVFSFQNLINLALLALMLHIQLNSNHIQMIFYAYLMLGIYLLYLIIYRVVKKTQISGIIKSGIFFVIAALLAVAMNADVMMTMKEYNKYSMRGEPGIEAKIDKKVADDQPLDYQYATNWSFSPGEVITFLLPYYYGFGDVEIQGQKANLYWGQMPFTTNPMYFGVIVLILAVTGIFYNFRKNPFVQAMTVISVVFLFMSFGRNFSLIYDLFFNYFPYFSSFRAPVMIHHFMNIAIVILSGFGLKSVIEIVKGKTDSDKLKKLCYVFFGIAGLMFLISIVGFEGSYTDSVSTSSLAEKLKQQGATAQQISQYIKQQIIPNAYANSISDLRLHAFFIAIVAGLMFMYATNKVSVKIFLAGTILIAVIDLWNVNFKTLHWDNPGETKNAFAETDFTNWLLKTNPDTYTYRVAEFNGGRLTTDNTMAYYRLHSFNGYHGAKIRIYQDAVDVAEGENPLLLTLGGVKYIISDKPLQDTSFVQVFKGTKFIYENKNFIPKAFFADGYKVEKDITILNNIREMNFDPRKVAFLEKDINQKIDKPDSTASVKLVKGDIHSLEYDVNATGNNLLVFSEIYLPFGWKAYIDGKESEIHKTDYILRSLVVPQGKHKVEFRYEPAVYYTGKSVSIGANVLLGIILLAGVFGYATNKKKSDSTGNVKKDENI